MKAKKPKGRELVTPVEGRHEQPIALPKLGAMFAQIDNEIALAVQAHDPENLFALASQLNEIGQTAGISLARLLWKMYENWEAVTGRSFPTDRARKQDFEQLIFTRNGHAKDTLNRYMDVGAMYAKVQESIPETLLKLIQERPISDQIAVAQNIKEHGPLPRVAWKEIAHAEDGQAVRNALKEVRGQEITGPDIAYHLDANGEFFAYVKRKRVVLGFLRAAEDDLREPARQRAYERLKKKISLKED